MNRRRFLTTTSLAALAALLPGGIAMARPDPVPLRRLPSGHYLVDNWVLTAEDVQALGLTEKARPLESYAR